MQGLLTSFQDLLLLRPCQASTGNATQEQRDNTLHSPTLARVSLTAAPYCQDCRPDFTKQLEERLNRLRVTQLINERVTLSAPLPRQDPVGKRTSRQQLRRSRLPKAACAWLCVRSGRWQTRGAGGPSIKSSMWAGHVCGTF